MPNRISIIIITYNRAADTLELLQSLSTQENKAEFLEETLVLNNASAENYDAVRKSRRGLLTPKPIWAWQKAGTDCWSRLRAKSFFAWTTI